MSNLAKTTGTHFQAGKKGIQWHLGSNEYLHFQNVFSKYISEQSNHRTDFDYRLRYYVIAGLLKRCFSSTIIPERLKITETEALALYDFLSEYQEESLLFAYMAFQLQKILNL
ncbi:MAG: hypothetical protein SFU27_06455 [Thermonemataceae bacterium]|nr:hypothetical protein [Thermonemataceae bacterium]